MITNLLPGVARLRHYERRWIGRDALAGVTVAAYLVPQVMGYATVAGLPVVAGLWTMVAALAAYVVFGSSPQLSVGPESTTAIMTALIIAPLAGGDTSHYAALASALALVVGALCVVARLARLGFMADLLSKPVLVGYLAGIAVLMIVGQLGRLTRVAVTGDSTIDQIRSFVDHRSEVHGITVLVAMATLALLVGGSRVARRWPLPLIGVLGATAVVAVFSLDRHGVALVGAVPSGFPTLGWPDVSRHDVTDLLVPAVGVAIVAFSDNTLTARSFAARNGYEISPNQELLALGASNAASGAFAGFPVSSSASRTAIADAMGSVTSMCSIVALAAVGAVMVAGRGVLAHFPAAALGAVVTFAALKLVDIEGFRRLGRFRRSELLLAVATTVAVLVTDVLYGVLVAVALSVIDVVRRVARPHDGILGFVPGIAGMHDVDDYAAATVVAGLVVYRYDSPLFFANAENFKRRALAAAEGRDGRTEWFVLNAEANTDIDSTALDALEQVRAELERRGIEFGLTRMKQELRQLLADGGFLERVGPDRVFMTLPTAVEAYRGWYRGRYGREPAGPEAPH